MVAICKGLQGFLDGPLSDAHGGNVRLRRRVMELVEEDGLEEEGGTRASGSFREKRLRGAEPLFTYQREILCQLDALYKSNKKPAALVALPTGAGKTRAGIWFFREKLAARLASRLLWVAPSRELVEQAVGSCTELWSSFLGSPELLIRINGFGGPIPDRGADRGVAVFVTSQLAARRPGEIRRFEPDILVFDEAHQSVARTYQNMIRVARSRGKTFVVGLSATPGRGRAEEGGDLEGIFDGGLVTSKELGARPVAELVHRGVLSRLAFKTIGLPKAWESIRVRSAADKSLSVRALSINAARFWATVEAVTSLQGARILVFGASLAHCFALVAGIREQGVAAEVLTHTTAVARRTRVLARFAAGDVPVLVNKSLLATGYDCPGITDVVLATPIRSPILWEQILGRASRGPAVGGSERGTVWELDDHRRMHRQMLSYARFLGDLWE